MYKRSKFLYKWKIQILYIFEYNKIWKIYHILKYEYRYKENVELLIYYSTLLLKYLLKFYDLIESFMIKRNDSYIYLFAGMLDVNYGICQFFKDIRLRWTNVCTFLKTLIKKTFLKTTISKEFWCNKNNLNTQTFKINPSYDARIQ